MPRLVYVCVVRNPRRQVLLRQGPYKTYLLWVNVGKSKLCKQNNVSGLTIKGGNSKLFFFISLPKHILWDEKIYTILRSEYLLIIYPLFNELNCTAAFQTWLLCYKRRVYTSVYSTGASPDLTICHKVTSLFIVYFSVFCFLWIELYSCIANMIVIKVECTLLFIPQEQVQTLQYATR